MKKTKNNNMLMHGFILVTVLATAKSAEAEITMEAAFQGHCGHTSPCEQLCYEIHDGMYECDCIEGYELNKNGYSCQVINSTSSGDGHSKSEEDVLYQKGASFSAKLANDNEHENQISLGYGAAAASSSAYDEDNTDVIDNYFSDNLGQAAAQQQRVNSNNYYISSESISFSNTQAEQDQEQELANSSQDVPESKANAKAKSRTKATSFVNSQQNILTTTKPVHLSIKKKTRRVESKLRSSTTAATTQAITNSNNEEDYYFKQDMSIYDDVNNNQLNLRPLSQNTYQGRHPMDSGSKTVTISKDNQQQLNKTATPAEQSRLSSKTNISNAITSTGSASDACTLDCGLDGVCDNSGGSSNCLCPFGRSGRGCTEETKVRVPRFSQKSWLAFPALRGAYKHVQIRVEFRPESFDGIILLSGERDDLTGDFMALLLNKGFVEFWFDCGSGVGSVRSRETILLNDWNSVIIYRHRWDAWLVLNHGTKVQGRSNGLFSRITFREPVFLGGIGNITGLAKRLPVANGFVGCIRRFLANEHEYKFEEHPLGDVTKGFDIQDCLTDKCYKYPCQHGGKCLPSDQGAICLCPIGFVGDLCEMRMDLQVPAFNGSSFLRYAPLGDSALIWLELKVILKPEHQDGIILYSGPESHGDFISLALTNGFVEFTFDLGSGPAVVRSEFPLTIGQWHTIKISRTARLAVLKIDKSSEVMTISSNGFWHLSLPENLFLGGVHHVDKLPLKLKSKPFFVGCIQKIDINGHSLAIVSEALGGTNIDNCPHACLARPCGLFSECIPQMENYECRCSVFNAECNKAAEVPLEVLQLNKAKNNSKANAAKQAPHEETRRKKAPSYKQTKAHNKERKGYQHKQAKANLASAAPTTTSTTTSTTSTAATVTPSTRGTKVAYNDDIEDDIIFRDVHGMHKKNVHNEQAQRSNNEPKPQRNSNTNKAKHQGKGHHQHDAKQDPHHKHHPIEHKLSRLPTHYESFQTNPDSDILTFDENIDVEAILHEDNASNEQNDYYTEYKDYKEYSLNANVNKHDETFDETESEPYAFEMDETSLFDDNDGTEEYHKRQLAQDMRRILTNPHVGHTTKRAPEAPAPQTTPPEPALIMSDDYLYSEEQSDNSDELLEPVRSAKEVREVRPAPQPTPLQPNTDWSLLKKLDLAADHQSHIGVRKNFGACFAGQDSYFHYNDAETMSRIISYNIDLNLRIKTHSLEGVLLWTGRQGTTDEDGDFLSLGIENGYLHFRYDLGSGEVDIRFNMTRVSDGLWHRVRAIRNSQEGHLEVDGRRSATQRAPGKLRQLNTDTGLYVGGIPDVSYFTRRKYKSGIVGCISEIVLAGELKLNFDANTLGTAHNVETGIL